MTDVVLAVDAGTTGVTSLLVDHEGKIQSRGYETIKQYYPKPGWVEHDPEQIWQAVLIATQQALSQAPECNPVALGCANQRETLLVWDRNTGAPLHNAIVWQCRRSEPICQELRDQGLEDEIHRKTGLRLDPYFSGTKALWLIRNLPNLAERIAQGEVCFGTVDTWLAWKLTGGAVYSTDPTNASRTLCYDIDRLEWDEELLRRFGLNYSVVPAVEPSGAVRGMTSAPGLPVGTPIASLVGDQQAALFGQACFEPGLSKATYGTGCFILTTTGTLRVDSSKGLLTTLTAGTSCSKNYALEGSVFIAGAALQWCRDNLRLFDNLDDGIRLANSAASSEGVVFVPAFSGLGSPYWAPDVRGAIFGLTGGSKSAHIVRAAVDAMVYQAQDVLEVMSAESGLSITELRVDGGAAANDRLMQLQADISRIPLSRSSSVETTALGAAFLAGLAVEFWRDEGEITSLRRVSDSFEPSSAASTAKADYGRWSQALDMLLSRDPPDAPVTPKLVN